MQDASVAFSIVALAQDVNAWCHQHGVRPLHNRVGVEVTVRNIRYYQSLGLVDRPEGIHGKGFREKHRLQLIAIRLLQAKGLPLGKIHSLLYGRSVDDLRKIEQQGLAELEIAPVNGEEVPAGWRLISLGRDWLLLGREGRNLSPTQIKRILDTIYGEASGTAPGLASGESNTTGLLFEPEEGFRPESD